MDIEEVIARRRSIRRFAADPVSAVDLRQMLALASQAPNIGNRQLWRFIVITDDSLLKMLATLVERRINDVATHPDFANHPEKVRVWKEAALLFADAPAVIVVVKQEYRTRLEAVLVERNMRPVEIEHLFSHPDMQSVSAVIAYFTLLAESRGYGACWMTEPLIAKKDFHASLQLAPGEEVFALVAVGKPTETPPPKARKPIDDLIEWR
jgi:nitroreductase